MKIIPVKKGLLEYFLIEDFYSYDELLA